LDAGQDVQESGMVERERRQAVRVPRERDQRDQVIRPAGDEIGEGLLDHIQAGLWPFGRAKVEGLHRAGDIDHHADRDGFRVSSRTG
jgi:hypothetical protein